MDTGREVPWAPLGPRRPFFQRSDGAQTSDARPGRSPTTVIISDVLGLEATALTWTSNI